MRVCPLAQELERVNIKSVKNQLGVQKINSYIVF